MIYNYEIQKKANYIRAYIEGTRTLGREVEDMLETLAEIAGVCHKEKCYHVMLVFDLKGKHSIVTALTLVQTAESRGTETKFQVAMVNHEPEFQAILRYVADLAAAKGDKSKAFENEQDAAVWLAEE